MGLVVVSYLWPGLCYYTCEIGYYAGYIEALRLSISSAI